MKIIDTLINKGDINQVKYFINENYKIIILPYNVNKPYIFFSIENEEFKEMKMNGLSSLGSFVNLSFSDESEENGFVIHYNNDQAYLEIKQGWKNTIGHFLNTHIIEDLNIDFIPFENPTIIESTYVSNTGMKFIITRPKTHWTYDDFHITIKDANDIIISELDCISLDRYRDGGTTYYTTKEGVLFTPSCFDKNKKANWQEKIYLERLD